MKHYSPLRYPGGKGKVADFFKDLIRNNGLYDCTYVEPYAGGASVGLSLLFTEYVSKIIINDIDRSIYAFWYCVLNKTEELCHLIMKTPATIETWEAQQEVQKRKDKATLLDLGFSTFFLNRTNRSGILNAGVIGGKKQLGKWKIDARYNKQELISRISKIAQFRNRIELKRMDALHLLQDLQASLQGNSLIYLDPPYHVKGKDLYLNYYCDEDHRRIAEELSKQREHKWVVTYDNSPLIREIYSSFRLTTYTLNYHAYRARTANELIIFSDNLEHVHSPS